MAAFARSSRLAYWTIVAILLLVLAVASRAAAIAEVRSPFIGASGVDFEAIYYFAQRASNTYKSQAAITNLDPGVSWVATPGHTHVLYFIEHDHARNLHIVAVRGTVDQTNWSLDKDTRGVSDSKAHILVHEGFDKIARTIYADLKQHLKPAYTIHLTGHSLGGAAAALLAIYLYEDSYKIGSVVTFGQPKFTNEAGVAEYAHLPILRVVNQNDVVPMLPDTTQSGQAKFAHLGTELTILSGPYYALLDPEQALRTSIDEFAKDAFLSSVPDHKIAWYLENLESKLQGAQRVNYADREQYVVRHRKGPTDKTKVKTNFNSAN